MFVEIGPCQVRLRNITQLAMLSCDRERGGAYATVLGVPGSRFAFPQVHKPTSNLCRRCRLKRYLEDMLFVWGKKKEGMSFRTTVQAPSASRRLWGYGHSGCERRWRWRITNPPFLSLQRSRREEP